MFTIVIVDDEAIVRYGIKHSVDWGALNATRVEEAFHGQEVLDRWDEWRPDLIVTDIKMPVMDGIELIKRAKERNPDCRFIVLSCIDEFEYVKEAFMLGASDYVLKMTVRPEDMTACIGRVIQEMIGSRSADKRMQPHVPSGERYKIEGFFRDILSHMYMAWEIVETAKSISVRTSFDRYGVAVMELNMREALPRYGSDGKLLVGYSVVNMLGEIAAEERDFDFFKLEPDEFVLVFDRGAEEPARRFEERVSAKLMRIAAGAETFLKLGVRFGVSEPEQSADRLIAAYKAAKRAAARCVFRPEAERIVFAGEPGPQRPPEEDEALSHRFAATLRKRLAASLPYAKEEETAAAVDEAFAMLSEDRCTPQAARACLAKAVSAVNLIVLESGEAGRFPPFDEESFDAGWNRDRTRRRLSAYCGDYIAFLRSKHEKSGRKLVRDIVAYLNEQYADKITLEQTAKHFYVNKTYLSELFKAETGRNFTRYLNEIRVERAKMLMLQTNMTMTEIAERVGFADFRYFGRVFKNHTELAPSEYRTRAVQPKRNGV
ncbi:response regulator transcription factor [Paenibacillus flagellatus]|uniref:DNA-binding response regulator n=1 Tax=Paenibacillus flagellatus TaxID=2211139 RepID=A0A2V5KFQ1_9BACL|nr:helix-turn-helix domain-containing protein [Paenibacillus flagellatus]PYI57344.1 hypothetical protein DLM86_02590 [Paenibacillus flagellatus]